MENADFEKEFKMHYPQFAYILRDMHDALGKSKVTWSDMTKVNLTKIVEQLKSGRSNTTARNLASKIKAFLNLWCEDVELPYANFAKVLSVRLDPSQQVALTEDEVMRLDAYVPRTKTETDIKILAMREVLCGARGSDVELMTKANIVDGEITYVAKKTRRSATIPAGKMFKKYMDMPVSKTYPRKTKNQVLKSMCERCGITQELTLFYRGGWKTAPKYKFVGFHTLRRTFASILASKGVPVTTIQMWMTHATPMQTARYIKVDMAHENKKYADMFV